MFLNQKPIPGYWYSNAEGQLLQVRAIRYDKGARSLIVQEDINGNRAMLPPEVWGMQDLVLHSPVAQAAS